MDCYAYCTAPSYLIKPLFEHYRTRYATSLYREALHIEIPQPGESAHIFCFPYGASVFWGLPPEKITQFLEEICPFEGGKLDEVEIDAFTYSYAKNAKVAEDEIYLPDREVRTKLAFSHGLAQSVKLGSFETTTLKTFNSAQNIPENLAARGKIPLSRKEIRHKMGKLFVERSSINLHVNVLDMPEIFWEHPEIEPYYNLIANYLDIKTRVEVLTKRLEIIHELFEMLGSELNHQHSSRLEITIILLIVVEVVILLLHEIF